MNNEEYITSLFENNFKEYKDKNIYIYGLSVSTKYILDNCTEFNICGLLDGKRKNDYMYDKYIYDINDLPSKHPDAIIIVARKGTTRVIYRRINHFCRENNIPLYDILGNDLLIEPESQEFEDEYFFRNSEQLKKEIDRHEVISFDIFDTLLMREVLFPHDVFEMIARENSEIPFDFVTERISAEQELLVNGNPNIEEIYDRISQKNHGYDIAKIIKCEIETEQKVLIARNVMKDILAYAVNVSKEIYIVSDMYLDSTILNKILSDKGITGYKEIIVSCEHGVSKNSGLFEVLKERIGNKSCIHIGDNEEADGISAQNAGFDSFLIKSAYEMTEISTIKNILDYMPSFNSRLHIALLISEIFNDPFVLSKSNGRIDINSADKLGKFIAPIISDFVLWLKRTSSEDKCENILFAARDGFLIKQMIELTPFDSTNYYYFLTSRSVAMISSIKNKEDITKIKKLPYTGSPEEMMKKRYLLDSDDIIDYCSFSDLSEYVDSHTEKIINNASKKRQNYLKYIENCNIDFSRKTGFFDFVSSGTSQLSLEKIIEKKLYGYYFININDDNPQKRKLCIKAMQGSGLEYEIKTNLYDKYIFLENILTSDKPTVMSFDDDGLPLYFDEYRNKFEINNILQIHKAILSYFTEYLKIYDKGEENASNTADIILGLVDGRIVNINSELLSGMVLRDDFNGTLFESNSMIQ